MFLLAVAAGIAHLALVRRIESRGARVFGLIAFAIALRLATVFSVEHGLSDDFHRYLWEGRVVLAGEDPYRHAPDDPALASLRDESIWPNVTHRHVPAAYPPLVLAFFALAAATPWPILFLRIGFVGAELLAWFLLARLLETRGVDRARSLVFGLAPLVILEYAGSFHFDSLAIAATVAAFLLRARGHVVASVIAIGLAASFKPHALVLAPLLVRDDRSSAPSPRPKRAALANLARMGLATILATAVFASTYAPFLRDGAPLAGLLRYANEWSFNAPFFPALRALFEVIRDHVHDSGWTALPFVGPIARAIVEGSPDRAARMILAAGFALAAIAIALSRLSRERAAAWTLATLLLASPTVQPWYLTWLLPFVAFEPRPSRSPLLLWAALAPLGYHLLPYFAEHGVWVESIPWRIAQYAPVLLWIGWRLSAATTFSSEDGAVGGVETPRAGKSDARLTQ